MNMSNAYVVHAYPRQIATAKSVAQQGKNLGSIVSAPLLVYIVERDRAALKDLRRPKELPAPGKTRGGLACTVSPRTRKAERKAPICEGVASPFKMISKALVASAPDRARPCDRRPSVAFNLSGCASIYTSKLKCCWAMSSATFIPAFCKKLPSNLCPYAVAMLSGWNCTP